MEILKIRLIRVADKEQIAKHADAVSLLAFTEKFGDCYAEHLAEKVKARSLDRCLYMDACTKVKCLVAADIFLTLGCEILLDLTESRLILCQVTSLNKELHFVERVGDLFTARYFADALVTVISCQNNNVTCKIRSVRAGEVRPSPSLP